MPRTIARLQYRYKQPLASVKRLDSRQPGYQLALEQRVKTHVVSKSNPRHLRIQKVVNAKSKPQAAGKFVTPPFKPHTLKDLVDPKNKAQHGEIIYIFRHVQTNQIIYSLQELLDNFHLEQLPFIGKHSKPTAIEPHQWVPHCVLTFPTPEQGHNAFRKLREFRKLHELAWEKNNPEWRFISKEQRMKKIMNQRANTSADIAEVLRLQNAESIAMGLRYRTYQVKSQKLLDMAYQSIHQKANAANRKKKLTDNVEWLEQQIETHDRRLKMRHNQTDARQKSLNTIRSGLKTRLKRIKHAQRKVLEEKALKKQAKLFKSLPGGRSDMNTLRGEIKKLQQALVDPDPTRSSRDVESHRATLQGHKDRLEALEVSLAAQEVLDAQDLYRTALPSKFKKAPRKPYTLHRVSVRWANLQDASYAKGQWHDTIEHELLPLNEAIRKTEFVSAEMFEQGVNQEVSQILEAIKREKEKRAAEEQRAKDEAKPQPILKADYEELMGPSRYLPKIDSQF